MNLITLDSISKSYGEKKLLDNVTLHINSDEKIGLIGINGTGKSTLLKIISGDEFVDSGTIMKSSSIRIEYLAQDTDFDDNATVIEQVLKGNSPEIRLLREYEETLQNIAENLDIDLQDKLMRLQSKIDNMNLWDLESEVKTILTKLDITDFRAKVGQLSGGQRKRIALATALITPCDLLILDEPTNHLDSESISWLEEYLNNRKGALLMITHDRYFLDRVTNRIIEIDKGHLFSYEGNYSVFVEKKIERDELEVSIQKKKRNLYRKELAWIKRGAKARSTKQKARIGRFEKLKDGMVNIQDNQLELSVLGSRLGNKIIEIENLCKSYEGKMYIKDFNYLLLRNDRIGIVGPNGAGKTTLMRLINGDEKPDSGTIEVGDTVKIGFFSQENDHMDDTMKVIDYVREIGEYLPLSNGDRISASKMLERFLFNADLQHNLIGKLSGGEKRRLYLLKILMGAPNVLLLDEPTNDLDIATLTILEDFIDGFNGPVITVSHDRYFLDRICNNIFSFKQKGMIERYNGNYSDYIYTKENEMEISRDKKNENVDKINNKKTTGDKPLKFSYNEQKEYEEINDVIESFENKLNELELKMEQFATDFAKIQEIMEEKTVLERKLKEKYDRWAYLTELAEKIEAQKKKL